jgi:hypothetical protein
MTKTNESVRICGFCMTGHHENCKPLIKWYDNEWYCYCPCEKQQEGEINEQSE